MATEAKKLTKEQKQVLIDELGIPYASVNLLCDGYRITLSVTRTTQLAFRVVTYVNGFWEGKWMFGSEIYPEQKFLNRRERAVVTPKQKAQAEKVFGKRAVAKDPWYSKKIVTYDVSWASGKAAIDHLCRVCESIEIVEHEAGAA